MTVINFPSNQVYIVLGIDDQGHDQVLSVFYAYNDAKAFCKDSMHDSPFYDLWIEKHPIL